MSRCVAIHAEAKTLKPCLYATKMGDSIGKNFVNGFVHQMKEEERTSGSAIIVSKVLWASLVGGDTS